MIKRKHILYLAIIIGAVTLTLLKIPIASSQGVSLVSSWVNEDLPVEDPASNLWQQATALDVPLSAQNVSKPFLLNSKIKSVTARALQNSTQIAFLVEWADPTQDDSGVAVQDFRDAAALQYPLSATQPFFCMGQVGSDVNLWHWKADWQAEITARKEMEQEYPNMYVDYYPYAQAAEGKLASVAEYTDLNYLPAQAVGNLLAAAALSTPVEDLVAGGFGTLTSQPKDGQNVQGFGQWKDGVWQVIFSRSLTSTEQDDISFVPGKTYSIAFAVWDGANQERNGQKSTSQWVSLQLSSPPRENAASSTEAAKPAGLFTARNFAFLLIGAIVVFMLLITLVYFRLPE